MARRGREGEGNGGEEGRKGEGRGEKWSGEHGRGEKGGEGRGERDEQSMEGRRGHLGRAIWMKDEAGEEGSHVLRSSAPFLLYSLSSISANIVKPEMSTKPTAAAKRVVSGRLSGSGRFMKRCIT